MSVSCKYCVLSDRDFCVEPINRPEEPPTECGVSECNHKSSTIRRSRPTGAVAPC